MPVYGSKLPAPIPEEVTVWSWLFDSDYADQRRSQVDKVGGFRDANTNEFLSYDEVKELATFLSTALAQKYNVGPGTNVSIFTSNSIWYPVALFSAVRLGAVVTGSSPEYGVEEVAYILKASSTELVYADKGSFKTISAAATKLGLPQDRIIRLDEAEAGLTSLKDLIKQGQSAGTPPAAWKLPPGQSNKNVLAYLSFTSGTTSLPKGVMISHHNVVAQILQMASLGRADLPKVLLGVLPLFHITGLVQILQLPVVLNQEVIMMPKFDMKAMLDTIMDYKCDELWLVPPLLIRLVNDPVAKAYDLPHVKQFNTGAAPLAKEIIDKLAKVFPHIAIRQAWGMTESTSALTLTPPALQTYDNAHTVGAVVPETVIKIVDPDTDKEVAPGESGEILAKGPQVTMGYLNNKTATAESYDSEGFLHTGDLGSFDDKGLLIIHDRLKEVIKVKGVGVAPAELEDLLLGHPLVVDTAVIGIPDDYAGEVPKAFVVLVPEAKSDAATAKQLEQFVREKKARSKWLSGGIEFLPQIPKSASGKILRRMLRDQERQKAKLRKQARL